MEDIDKTYIGTTEDQIWQQISADINDDTLEYHAVIQQADAEIYLDIDIDLGGGFEGGYETTSLRAPVTDNLSFQFAVHEDHFTDDIGKFFGLQDVKIGYPDLDKHLVIKTNDQEKVKTLFADELTRKVFTQLSNFDFGIRLHTDDDTKQKQAFLELNIEEGIIDTTVLRNLYHAFYMVLKGL